MYKNQASKTKCSAQKYDKSEQRIEQITKTENELYRKEMNKNEEFKLCT